MTGDDIMEIQVIKMITAGALVLLAAIFAVPDARAQGSPRDNWEMRDGRFYDNGEWVFLKIAKPLRDFGNADSVDQLIAALDTLQAKHYNCLELTCYWHHFDPDGDGEIEVSLEPLSRLINELHQRGMYVSLGVETYAVGGGTIPAGFWDNHPGAVAVNSEGDEVYDSEYGFGSRVPSQFSPEYLEFSRKFIRNLALGVPVEKVLYFETTVEPQYMGNQSLCYSEHARLAYEAWVVSEQIADAPAWPGSFPVPGSFVQNAVWNRFRAESLAAWVNGDMAAFREVAGEDAWVAVDYLETGGADMTNRLGDSLTFLRALGNVTILQVNWHWHIGTRSPNMAAYDNVRAVDRDWAVSEHMTLNGSDYYPSEVEDMLLNTLQQGTGFGWDFVNVAPSSGDPFSLYNDDWSPKPLIAEVDDKWDYWMEQVRAHFQDPLLVSLTAVPAGRIVGLAMLVAALGFAGRRTILQR
jgi:hypothetical protein